MHKTRRRIYLNRSDDAVAEYKYNGDGHQFKDDDDLQEFLNAYKGTGIPNFPNLLCGES